MKALTVLFVLVLFIGLASLVAMANSPPVVPTPPPTGGGGGGGGGVSYSAPVFKPYTDPIKTSDGTTIGQLTGKNFNDVAVSAMTNGTVGNVSYNITLVGDLSSLPTGDYWLDIDFLSPGSAEIPLGMDNGPVLGVINITSSPNGWNYDSGSPTYTLTITGLSQNLNFNDTYYMVLSDGTNYQVQPVNISFSGSEATLQFNPPGATGTFTIVGAPIVSPTPVPTPTATPTPEPTSSPTPFPVSNNIGSFPILLAMFAIGAIAGAAVIFLLNIHR
jgi:hypothetical protein